MLTNQEFEFLKSLPEDQQEYVKAKYSEPIKSTSDVSLRAECKNIVDQIFKTFYNGKEIDVSGNSLEGPLNFIKKELFDDLRKPKFLSVTMEQIALACYKGVRGTYGKFFSPNIREIHAWIDGYLNSKENKEALNNFILLVREAMPVEKEITTEEKFAKSKPAIISAFNDYKEVGVLPIGAHRYYAVICEIKGVKTLINDATRERIFQETAPDKINVLIREKVKSEWAETRQITQAIISKLSAGIDKASFVLQKQKELALKYYFDTLIKEGKEIEL